LLASIQLTWIGIDVMALVHGLAGMLAQGKATAESYSAKYGAVSSKGQNGEAMNGTDQATNGGG
jgi:hypothetical protein